MAPSLPILLLNVWFLFCSHLMEGARSVVVMDNASIHHVQQVTSLIQNTGAILHYLPAYSPDYNPLEESFSKVKAFLRDNNVSYETTGDPRLLIMMAFNSVTVEDCEGFIKHAGYVNTQ